MADELDVIGREMADYVALRRRLDDPVYDLDKAIREHRRQCLLNLADTGDTFWSDRIGALERLADKHNYPLADEPPLQPVLDELRRAERTRVSERIARQKAEHA